MAKLSLVVKWTMEAQRDDACATAQLEVSFGSSGSCPLAVHSGTLVSACCLARLEKSIMEV
jgi:hypothetical protein